jgi:DmsE family decaheme c-type cytochrome
VNTTQRTGAGFIGCAKYLIAAALAMLLAGPVMSAEPADAKPADATPVATAGTAAPASLSPAGMDMTDATYVGEKACIQCHQIENKHFGHTTHAKVFRENPKNDLEKRVCEACHGPGSKHVPEADNKKRQFIIGFTKEWRTPIATQTAQCLACHKGGQRINWPGSTHQANQLSCSDCHNPMVRLSANGLLKKESITQTCESCHPQQRAEFSKRSHMPVHEGKMTCEDCHNPHGSVTKPLLKASSVNEVCYQCHAEKRGPYIWEHAPVRENCLNCHLPHGSNHDKLLASERPYLCNQCHSVTGAHASTFYQPMGQNAVGNVPVGTSATANAALNPSMRIVGRSCQNCHSQIHGSNSPSGARFQR